VVELILIDSIAALANPTRPDGLCAASYVVSCVFNVFTESLTWACLPAPEFKFWVFLRRIAVHVAAFDDLDCEVSRPIMCPPTRGTDSYSEMPYTPAGESPNQGSSVALCLDICVFSHLRWLDLPGRSMAAS
jgi:hypothetical protein